MDADDASSAEMRRLPANPDADPLALDEDTVERLLTGDPSACPGAGRVRRAGPAPGGGGRRPDPRGAGRPGGGPGRVARRDPGPATRRQALAPGPNVQAASPGRAGGGRGGGRAGYGRGGRSGHRSPPGTGAGGGPDHPRHRRRRDAVGLHPGGPATGAGQATSRLRWRPGRLAARRLHRPGAGRRGAGPAAAPNLEGLCRAVMSGNGAEQGGKLDATAFEVLARAAGGKAKIDAYCRALVQQATRRPGSPRDPRTPSSRRIRSSPSSRSHQGVAGRARATRQRMANTPPRAERQTSWYGRSVTIWAVSRSSSRRAATPSAALVRAPGPHRLEEGRPCF